MDVLKDVGADHCVKVGIHEIKHQVDVTVVFSTDYILKSDNVFMSRQFLQEDDLSEGALCISGILKCIKVFLESYDLFGSFVNGFPHNTVGSLT